MPAAPARRPGPDRRDAIRQDGASRGPQREARRPRKGRGHRSPARRRTSRPTSASFGEHVRSRGRGPSTPNRRRQALAAPPSRRPLCPPRDRRPSQRIVPRLVPGRVTPSWSSPRASSRRRRRGPLPRERSPCGMTLAYPVARPPHRRESSIRLTRTSDAGLARLPRRLVRPVPGGAPGRQAVDPQGTIRSSRSTSTGARRGRRDTASSAVPTFIVVDRSGRELDRTSGLQPAADAGSGSTSPPGPRPSRPATPAPMPCPATTPGPIPETMKTQSAPCGGSGREQPRQDRPRSR